MSEKRITRDFLQRAGTYVFSTAVGAAVSIALVFLTALIMYVLQTPLQLAGYFSLFSIGTGCMVSGFICGSIKKRKGLLVGLECAVILMFLCVIGTVIGGTLNGTELLPKLITCVLTGCTGGVLGVNREHP